MAPIYLFTDFGLAGPYVGQMKGAILNAWPAARIIDLMHDAPALDPKASAYLLAAAIRDLPADATIVAVVDPGVGGNREALMAEADVRKLVGPDNGLLEIALRRADQSARHFLEWRPEHLSASFHGRDLFGPAATRWAAGEMPASSPPRESEERPGADWPDDLAQIIYIDGYGNAMTGLRTATLPDPVRLTLPDGFGFWYENSLGLAEIAVNGGSAARKFGLMLGDPVSL